MDLNKDVWIVTFENDRSYYFSSYDNASDAVIEYLENRNGVIVTKDDPGINYVFWTVRTPDAEEGRWVYEDICFSNHPIDSKIGK